MEELQKELNEKQKSLDIIVKQHEEKELQLRHERDKIVVRLKKPVLGNYQRIMDAKTDHIAVVPVVRGACGGCFNAIPPQTVVEIRKMNKIIKCEGCGRILVWTGNGQVDNS